MISTPPTDDLIPIGEVPGKYQIPGRGGKLIHPGTVRAWTLGGVRGVVLRSVCYGHDLYTRDSWVREFLAALSATGRGRRRRRRQTQAEVALAAVK